MSSVITLHTKNFKDEVLQSDIPVLLDFWAPWCGPCKMITPFIEQLGEEYAGRIKACKINIDEESELAEQHSISSIPTLIVYNNGEIAVQRAGAIPKRDIEAMFKNLIGG
jgi:thioredoxin 1